MKKIGLLSGMGWYSTSIYYNRINNYINRIRDGKVNPEVIIYTFNFAEISKHLEQGDWSAVADYMIPKAIQIEKAGADFLVITSNTMHKVRKEIEANINIPIVNIVDVVGKKLKKTWCKKPGLLATKYLINDGFYQERLKRNYGQEVIIPDPREVEELNDIIINELICNNINLSSRFYINSIIDNLMFRNVDSIILGCTELSSLIDIIAAREVRIIDSMELHIREIVHYAIKKNL